MENEREGSDDDNECVRFVLPVLADKNAVFIEEEVAIGNVLLKLRRCVGGDKEEADVTMRVIVRDESIITVEGGSVRAMARDILRYEVLTITDDIHAI